MKRARPRGLGAAGRRLYDETVANVADGWELDVKDYALLDRACKLADRAAALERVLDAEGEVTAGSRGQRVVHPAVAEARAHHIAIGALMAKVEIQPPSKSAPAQRASAQLRDARRARWSRG